MIKTTQNNVIVLLSTSRISHHCYSTSDVSVATIDILKQTDRQVVASGRKLNLRRDLRWVAERTPKLPRKSRKSQKMNILMQTIIYFIG